MGCEAHLKVEIPTCSSRLVESVVLRWNHLLDQHTSLRWNVEAQRWDCSPYQKTINLHVRGLVLSFSFFARINARKQAELSSCLPTLWRVPALDVVVSRTREGCVTIFDATVAEGFSGLQWA